ncbi:hypothetical protein ACFO0A_10410 [Novosphingobium tardum]|uniref:Uncharacterized protein n=1 Tax=Novosphingobium tardum TaxID=1538021 RepID=A0ABV8RT03_9SPHN
MTEHCVNLTEDQGRFLVAVMPPCNDYPPQIFPDYRQARGFAAGIRLCRRWPIHDHTREADNG